MNPLLPTPFDTTAWFVVLLGLVLFVVALLSLGQRTSRMTPGRSLGWLALILLLPVAGSAAWLLIGRKGGQRMMSEPSERK